MQQPSYLITAVTAMNIGIAGTLATNGITAKAQTSLNRNWSGEVTIGQGAQTTVENFFDSRVCPQVDSDYGLTGNDVCGSDKAPWTLCIRRQEFVDEQGQPQSRVVADARYTVMGSRVPGSGQ
jgi:hypothetical protein